MLYTKNFYSDIPIEKREIVLEKIEKFEKQLIKVKSFSMLPKGFWVRHIEGTDVYKFRVNNGDRIVFKYGDTAKQLIYLAYSTHDHQIRKAKNVGKNLNYIDSKEFEIDKASYEEDDEDLLLNVYIRNLYKNTWHQIEKEIVLEEEYIPLAIQSREVQDKQFLTQSQFECLNDKNNPIIVMGCAGSGKTLIALAKLKFEYRLGNKVIYITNNEIMKNGASNLCIWLNEEERKKFLFSLPGLCWEILKETPKDIIGYEQFKVWLREKDFHLLSQMSAKDIWNEISGTIKGCAVDEKPIISKRAYLETEQSQLGKSLRNEVYVLAVAYQNWLNKNSYWDQNDLIKAATSKINKSLYEGIIYDEVQELNLCAVMFLNRLVGDSCKVFLLGDQNQNLNLAFNNTDFLKQNLTSNLSLRILNKNFRNKLGVVKWNNRLKCLLKDDKLEEAITLGKEPYYFESNGEEVYSIFDAAAQDTESIVVVGSDEDREVLCDKGCNIDRIFTVEECRGLEYERVYCYKLIEYTESVGKYNALYIAGTRAKEKLFFIETMTNVLINEFEGYYSKVEWESLYSSFEKQEDKNRWLKEAHKLESKQKYQQAAAAYKKAGDYEQALLCQKAYEKQIAEVMLQERGSILDIYADTIQERNIEEIFDRVCCKNNKLEFSWIYIILFHESDGLPMIRNLYIPLNGQYKEEFKPIVEYMKRTHINSKRLIIKCVLEQSSTDYCINIYKGKVSISEKRCDYWRREEEIRKEMERQSLLQFGCLKKSPIREITDDIKRDKQSTEDILKEINISD